MGRHRTPEEKAAFKEQAVALRRAGVGAKRIAQQLGIGGALVHELLRGEPVPSSLRRPLAKDELRGAAVALRLEGRSYGEIRDELGVSKGSLSLWLRELPLDERRRAALADDDGEPHGEGDRGIARRLRREGWLLREIAEELGARAGTVHGWCAGIAVPARAVHGRPPEQMQLMTRASWDEELARREGERQQEIAEHRQRVRRLTDRELDLVAATAYWCEGAKSKPWARREKPQFINSDPDLVVLLMTWLERRGVGLDRCRLSVNIHESADLSRATAIWAEVVGCGPDAFAKPVIKRHNPRTTRKNTGETYIGCLAIGVRQSVHLYREVEGLWRGIVARLAERRSAAD